MQMGIRFEHEEQPPPRSMRPLAWVGASVVGLGLLAVGLTRVVFGASSEEELTPTPVDETLARANLQATVSLPVNNNVMITNETDKTIVFVKKDNAAYLDKNGSGWNNFEKDDSTKWPEKLRNPVYDTNNWQLSKEQAKSMKLSLIKEGTFYAISQKNNVFPTTYHDGEVHQNGNNPIKVEITYG